MVFGSILSVIVLTLIDWESCLQIPLFEKWSAGPQTKFWEDIWCDSRCKLKDMFPRLFALETEKNVPSKIVGYCLMDPGQEIGNGGVRLLVAHQVILPLSLK